LNSQTPFSAWLKLLAASALSVGVALVAQAQEGGSKIGFVDSNRIIRESAPARAAEVKIEQEFSKRGKELQEIAARFKAASDKFDKEMITLSETERTRRQRELAEMDAIFQRKQREFREDLNQRKNEELGQVLERTNKVLKQIAEQEKYDIILQEAAYNNPRIDITDKVLKALNSK
jgi:outer membrane protein